MITKTMRSVTAYIVWAWLASTGLHGIAHLAVGAPLTPLPTSLFWVGIGVELFFSLGPLAALALLYTRQAVWGAWLLLVTMLIALLWGYGGHFLSASGDNVMAHMGSPGGPAFLITSVLVFIFPWAGISAAIFLLRQASRRPSVPGAADGEGVPQARTARQAPDGSRV